jgi:hypothetical protein
LLGDKGIVGVVLLLNSIALSVEVIKKSLVVINALLLGSNLIIGILNSELNLTDLSGKSSKLSWKVPGKLLKSSHDLIKVSGSGLLSSSLNLHGLLEVLLESVKNVEDVVDKILISIVLISSLSHLDKHLEEGVEMSRWSVLFDLETEAYQDMLHEHEMVRMMIEQAREIMRGLLNDPQEGEFLQLETNKIANTFNAFASHLSSFKVKENTPSAHFNTFFQMLIKMAERTDQNNADQYLVNNILNILDRLQENLEQSMEIERTAEQTRARDFDEIMARLEELSRNLPAQLAALTTEISQIQFRIENANDQIAAQQ